MGIISVFGFTVSFGAKRKGRLGAIRTWLIIGMIAYLSVFTLLTMTYWDYAEKGTGSFIGGLPVPTALMLYGLGTVPLILTLTYIIKFRDWILTEEDEARFQELVARRNK